MFNIFKKIINPDDSEMWTLVQQITGSISDLENALVILRADGNEYRAEQAIIGGSEILGE